MATQPIAPNDLSHILSHTRECWEEARGCRIFLTGGTGFFGCWLLESFVHINHSLRLNAHAAVLTRDPQAFARKCPHLAAHPAITLHAGDVRNCVWPNGEFAYFIHAATDSVRQAAEGPREMLTTILEGTENALEFAATHGTRKFLLTSSGAVYGKQPSDLTHIPESYMGGPDPLDPSSAYGEGKRMAEQMCMLASNSQELNCKIARCFAFIGPHLPLHAHFAIGNFIRDAIRGSPIHIRGDGSPHRSYLYAADLAIWLWTILFRGLQSRAYNVGSEDSISILELARATRDALRPELEIRIAKPANSDTSIARYVPATGRAREELGLRQHIDLRDAIQRTARWYQF